MTSKQHLKAFKWLIVLLPLFVCHGLLLSVEANPAVQKIYLKGVPHTTKNGKRLSVYDAKRSFFLIGSWGVPESRIYKGVDYRWKHLVEAGYNTVWPWAMGGYTSEKQLQQAREHNLQVIIMRRPLGASLERIKLSQNLLGIVWQDEPLINFGIESERQQKELVSFKDYRKAVQGVLPDLPVFVNTASWMVGNGRSHWIDWHKVGDISCHDNYVIWPVTKSLNLGSYGTEKNGIADATTLAVKVNQEAKPVWLVVGAFEANYPPTVRFPFRYPTPMQLRGIVYTGIIHGATGVTYYAWDSNVTRFGVAPVEQRKIPGRPSATPIQAITANALWKTIAVINSELIELTPEILSPTVNLDYVVSFTGDAVTEYPLRTLLKPHRDGGYVLFTVNMDNTVVTGTFIFPSELSSAEPMFENRSAFSLGEDKRSFVIAYEPFEVHVVRID